MLYFLPVQAQGVRYSYNPLEFVMFSACSLIESKSKWITTTRALKGWWLFLLRRIIVLERPLNYQYADEI